MACELTIHNETPLQLMRLPNDTYPISASFTYPNQPLQPCQFRDERLTAVINGVPHMMAPVYASAPQWRCSYQAIGSFDAFFIGRYRSRWFRWFPWRSREVRSPAAGVRHYVIVPPPAVTVAPQELMFYFDDNVPNTDRVARLSNGMATPVHVSSATIQDNPEALGGAGGHAYFTLVSPQTFDFLVPASGSQDFVVRFTNSTAQRGALLVVNTGQGARSVRLSGKYFLW